MLLIASENSRHKRAVKDVVREMSLTLTIFASTETLAELMGGRSRRLVLLAETDVSDRVVATLREAEAGASFGVIVAADRHSPRDAGKVAAFEQLAKLENIEWVRPNFGYNDLSSAARACRSQMLRVSRDDLDEALRERQFIVQYQPKVQRELCDPVANARSRGIGPLATSRARSGGAARVFARDGRIRAHAKAYRLRAARIRSPARALEEQGP